MQKFYFDFQRITEAIKTILLFTIVSQNKNVVYQLFETITKPSVYSFSQQITAAVKIQSAFRGFTQRRRYRHQRAAAIILQRRFRVLQLARVKEENLRRRHNAAVYLQALWRGWLARQQARNVITKAVHK